MPVRLLLVLAASILAGLSFGILTAGSSGTSTRTVASTERAPGKPDDARPGARALNELDHYALEVLQNRDNPRETISRFLTSLATADVAQLQTLLRYALSDSKLMGAEQEYYAQAIVDRLIEMGQPMAALSIPGLRPDRQDHLLSRTLKTLAEKNPAEAENLLLALHGREQVMALGAILPALGEKDPERGLGLLEKFPESRNQASQFFAAWAKTDPTKALAAEALRGAKNPRNRSYGALREIAKNDPDAAWDWISALPPDQARNARNTYLQALADDPAKAIAEVLKRGIYGDSYVFEQIGNSLSQDMPAAEETLASLPPGELRSSIIDGIAKRLGARDLDKALAWVGTLTPEEKEHAINDMVQTFSYQDPEKALLLAENYVSEDDRSSRLGRVFSSWMQNDPEAAMLAVSRYTDPKDLQEIVPQLLSSNYGELSENASTVFRMLEALPHEMQASAWVSAGGEIASLPPSQVLSQLQKIAPEYRSAFAKGLLESSSYYLSPDEQEVYLEFLTPDARREMAHSISQSYLNTDPAKAVQYLQDLPPVADPNNQGISQTLQSTFESWAAFDPVTALQSARDLAQPDLREAALRGLAESMLSYDPDGATRLLPEIRNQDQRQQIFRNLVSSWQKIDPVRGRAVLSALATNDQEKQLISSQLGGQP